MESSGVGASFDRDTDFLGNIGLALSYTHLDYDPPFNAKDTDVISLNPSLFFRVHTLWTIFSVYSHQVGNARTGPRPSGSHDDISYKAQAFSIKITHRLSTKTKIRFRYKIRKKRFTTGSDDALHLGRKDTHYSIYAAVQHLLKKNLLLISRVDRLWKNSTDSFVEFNENRLMFSVSYLF